MSRKVSVLNQVERLTIVGVMGSGKSTHVERACVLGNWLAQTGVHLLCGGGGGVMAAVSKAFAKSRNRKGRVIGIIPGKFSDGCYTPLTGYPNQWTEIPIYTHLPYSGTLGTEMESRNHINVLTSDVIVFLPGSAGTAAEAQLAARYGKPAIAWIDSQSDIEGVPDQIPVSSQFDAIKKFVMNRINAHHG